MARMKLGFENEQSADLELSDLYISSAVSLIVNITPEYTIHDGKVYFRFPRTSAVSEAMVSYNNGIMLNAFDFATRIKRLRAMMLVKKNELSQGQENGRRA